MVDAVYPRVGGGNELERINERIAEGLSPRGRGKLTLIRASPLQCGSIPAWAGETAAYREQLRHYRVYPRVGGGNAERYLAEIHQEGLSPRGRGKLPRGKVARENARSIPAWAGETVSAGVAVLVDEVYPRVGGGNAACYAQVCPPEGLSPRGRGKPQFSITPLPPRRSIPAWAGETNTP